MHLKYGVIVKKGYHANLVPATKERDEINYVIKRTFTNT
jgi:hypothetical protein